MRSLMRYVGKTAFGFLAFAMALFVWKSDGHTQKVDLNAQIGGDLQRTRFVAFLATHVDYRVFSIADPYRIVVDLPEVNIQVPGNKTRGLVLSSRAGLLSEGKSRIVIDLVEPALVEKSEILPAENGLPARLVIDLTKTTHKSFLASARLPPPLAKSTTQPKLDGRDRRPVIVIDAGHGGLDNGAHGRILKVAEKEVTFDFATALKEHLEQIGRYRVVMTRNIDIFLSLEERAQIASAQNAELFISIHADALDPKRHSIKGLNEIRGATIYTLSEQASDDDAKAMAQRENKSDIQAGVTSVVNTNNLAEIEGILHDLETRTKKNRSLALAKFLVSDLQGKMKFNVKPERSAPFGVLKTTGVPAILFELGYLSNEEDEKLLSSKEWRHKTSKYVADSIHKFLSERQVRLPL